jgi:hypothetical protein
MSPKRNLFNLPVKISKDPPTPIQTPVNPVDFKYAQKSSCLGTPKATKAIFDL